MDKTKIAIEVFDKGAELYQEKFMDLKNYHASFDLFCESVKKENAEILELGCGPGNITKYLLSKRSDFKILGTDLAPRMLELARINNPSATFELMDCRDILKPAKKFDGLVFGFCFPYISKEDALQIISDAKKVLNEKGIIYISTMEDDYSKSDFKLPSSGVGPAAYIYYHQADYLTAALIENDFEILDLSRVDYPQPAGPPTIDLILIARRKQ
ncbi:MAG: class I SAM-dependent methyltransferase [Crocinitomicaceae bacterium]|nr:class I SAM-dependent methyltransferase [Crocinitomicaceae bacterium]